MPRGRLFLTQQWRRVACLGQSERAAEEVYVYTLGVRLAVRHPVLKLTVFLAAPMRRAWTLFVGGGCTKQPPSREEDVRSACHKRIPSKSRPYHWPQRETVSFWCEQERARVHLAQNLFLCSSTNRASGDFPTRN